MTEEEIHHEIEELTSLLDLFVFIPALKDANYEKNLDAALDRLNELDKMLKEGNFDEDEV